VRSASVVTDTTKSVVLDREVDEEKKPASRNRRAYGALYTAGRLARNIAGSWSAAVSGTRSIREVSAQPASTSGVKLSVSRVAAGRPTPFWYATI